jgi:hypothetical protein
MYEDKNEVGNGGMLFWESKFIFVDAVKVEQDEGLCVGLVVV